MKKKYKCSICGKKFSSKKGLLIHKSKVHKKIKKKVISKKLPFILAFLVLMSISVVVVYNILSMFDGSVDESPALPDPIITIHSPLNKTYYRKNVAVNVSCSEPCLWIKSKFEGNPAIFSQGQPITWVLGDDSMVLHCTKCYSYELNGLEFSQGVYEYRIVVEDYNETKYEKTIVFTVDI